MKRSGLLVLLCAFIAVIILTGTASFAQKKKAPQDTITFEGNLTLNVNGKDIKVSKSKSIPMPETLMAGTQDDHPIVMYQIFNEEGYITRRADVIVRTSKPFRVSGKRVLDVSEIATYEDEYTDPAPGLVALRGKTIPAKTGDYYIGIKVPKEEEEIDGVVLLYVKIRVEAEK